MAAQANRILERIDHPGAIRELYESVAWGYDAFTGYERPHHARAIELADIRPGEDVLEVACGTGRATVELARRVSGGRFSAVDLTEAMMARARGKLEKAGLRNRVALRLADARRLPFADASFDVLYNSYMFDLIDAGEIPGVVAEFRRVLKPGGRMVLINMSKDTAGKTLYEWLYERGLLFAVSGGCRPVKMAPYLEEAGFTEIRHEHRRNRSWIPLNLLFGTEIVTAIKPR